MLEVIGIIYVIVMIVFGTTLCIILGRPKSNELPILIIASLLWIVFIPVAIFEYANDCYKKRKDKRRKLKIKIAIKEYNETDEVFANRLKRL